MSALAALIVCGAGPAGAATDPSGWPVRRAGEAIPPPCWAGDALTLRLTPAAARALLPHGAAPLRAGRLAATRIAALDRVAAVLGVTLAPMFPGEPAAAGRGADDFTAWLRAELPPGLPLETAERMLRDVPGVAGVERVAILPVDAVPNDSLFSRQDWFNPAAGVPRHDTRAAEAWDHTTGDTSVVVGIIDTGMLPYHPELGGTDGGPGNRYINWSEAEGTPGVDDDLNGYVDDVSGWDFVHVPTASVRAGEDRLDEDNDPNDHAGHGTLVAGIVGARANNGSGVAGTAWRVRLLPLRIGWSTTAAPLGEIRMDFAAAAIRYATRLGADIVNCSFASLNQNGIDVAVSAATRAGVRVVVSAGNSGQPHYLGDREDVLAVASVDSLDGVSSFSNRYGAVDVAAQGTQVWSTFVVQTAADSLGYRTPGYGAGSGTSFAAPQVAGGLVLLDAWRRAQGLPRLSPFASILRVRESAEDIAWLNPTRPGHGAGRLDLERLLTAPTGSLVTPGGARTVGPPAVLVPNRGEALVAWATSDARLVGCSGATLDTLFDLAIGHPLTPTLAAADLGGGLGIALAVGTSDGRVFAFTPDGLPLPGLPAAGLDAGAAVSAITFRDGDGDGVASIVAAAADGRVHAWNPRTGAADAGFPWTAPGGAAPALAAGRLAAGAGDDLVLAAVDGSVHVLDGAGQERGGWPVAVAAAPRAPVLARLSAGGAREPAVLVSSGASLHAFGAGGAPLWTQVLPATPATDPAIADIDGDGSEEILLGYPAPFRIERRDSLGFERATAGWPVQTGGAVSGALLAGPLRTGGRMAVLATVFGGFSAWTDSGVALAAFPKPGGAAGSGALADVDADGATELAAGSGVDSSLFLYDAGPGTHAEHGRTWPADRGGDARRADALAGRGPLAWDRIPPAPVTVAAGEALGAHALRFRWVATGDDSLAGAAHASIVTFVPTNLAGVAPTRRDSLPARAPGIADTIVWDSPALPEGVEYDVTVRVRDDQGNLGPPSAVVRIALPVPVRATVTDLRVIATTDTSVTLAWTPPDLAVIDQAFTVAAARAPLDSASFDQAPVLEVAPASGDPDPARVHPVRGLATGQRWWFAVRVLDQTGEPRGISNVVSAITGPAGPGGEGSGLALAAFHNPSGRPVRFDWRGDGSGEPRQALALHDAGGRLVRRFALGGLAGGAVNWDGRDAAGRLVPAGVYFARLTSGSLQATARVALLP